MSQSTDLRPMSRREIVEAYFMEHRAKVLDIAAFLDRVDHAAPGSAPPGIAPGSQPGRREVEDFRLAALRGAIEILMDGQPERARRILELWSDPTSQPVEAAPGKGAVGVWPGNQTQASDKSQ